MTLATGSVSAEKNFSFEVSRPGIYNIEPKKQDSVLTTAKIRSLTQRLNESELAQFRGLFVLFHSLSNEAAARVPPFGEWGLTPLSDRAEFLEAARRILLPALADVFPKVGKSCTAHILVDKAVFDAERLYQTRGKELLRIPANARLTTARLFVAYKQSACPKS